MSSSAHTPVVQIALCESPDNMRGQKENIIAQRVSVTRARREVCTCTCRIGTRQRVPCHSTRLIVQVNRLNVSCFLVLLTLGDSCANITLQRLALVYCTLILLNSYADCFIFFLSLPSGIFCVDCVEYTRTS